jgi:hypothetical protein
LCCLFPSWPRNGQCIGEKEYAFLETKPERTTPAQVVNRRHLPIYKPYWLATPLPGHVPPEVSRRVAVGTCGGNGHGAPEGFLQSLD